MEVQPTDECGGIESAGEKDRRAVGHRAVHCTAAGRPGFERTSTLVECGGRARDAVAARRARWSDEAARTAIKRHCRWRGSGVEPATGGAKTLFAERVLIAGRRNRLANY